MNFKKLLKSTFLLKRSFEEVKRSLTTSIREICISQMFYVLCFIHEEREYYFEKIETLLSKRVYEFRGIIEELHFLKRISLRKISQTRERV